MSPITALVLTSPIPSNPDTSMIEQTVMSVKERLPDAKIVILCDGVRKEQEHRRAAYDDFLTDLHLADFTTGCTIVQAPEHWHQSGMMRNALPAIQTPYILFMEHDTPLEGEIPFDDIIYTMVEDELSLMRFMHEVQILEGHEHLFLTRDGFNLGAFGEVPYCRTIQFSARPHIARTDWYRDVIHTYFGKKARTFIEDVMHGVVQHDADGNALNPEGAWARWRMAVYAPEGSWKRSGNLDGRGDDPKYRLCYDYDGERPFDAPPPGWTE